MGIPIPRQVACVIPTVRPPPRVGIYAHAKALHELAGADFAAEGWPVKEELPSYRGRH